MELTGTYTNAGLELLARTSTGGAVTITRVMAGTGDTDALETAADLTAQKQILTLTGLRDGQGRIPAVLTAALAEEAYDLTELGVFAQGESGEEILLCIYRLDAPVAISPNSATVLRLLLSCAVSRLEALTVTPSPAGLVTVAELLEERTLLSHPNLLDNWDFRNPVNQRGITASTQWENAYGLDRWRSSGVGSVQFTGNSVISSGGCLLQFFEPGWLRRNTYTISAKVKGGNAPVVALGYWFGAEEHTIATTQGADGIYTGTITMRTDDAAHNGYIYIGLDCEIEAVKLELGPVSTLANDTPADYGAELAKCQRYYLPLGRFEIAGICHDAGQILFYIPIPVSMRTIPALHFSSKACAVIYNGVVVDWNATLAVFGDSSASLQSNGILMQISSDAITNVHQLYAAYWVPETGECALCCDL